MKPGATIKPSASMTLAASWFLRRPIFATRPSLIARSSRHLGSRVPSTIIPPRIIVSNSAISRSSLAKVVRRGVSGVLQRQIPLSVPASLLRRGPAVTFLDTPEAGEVNEFFDIDLISPSRFRIGEVGKPFEVGGQLGEVAELGRSAHARRCRH